MTDRDLINALESGALASPHLVRCPCGIQRSVAPAFHRRTTNHDCVHHPRKNCGHCRSVDRLIAGVEARLWVEAVHGPFEV